MIKITYYYDVLCIEWQEKGDIKRKYILTYDANGNITSDYSKGITKIKYNSLNLRQVIQFKNGNAIYYTYNAMGEKHKTEYYTIKSEVQIPMGSIMPYSANDVPSIWQVGNGSVSSLDDSKYHIIKINPILSLLNVALITAHYNLVKIGN